MATRQDPAHLVHDVHVLVSDAVPLVVLDLRLQPEVPGRALQVRRDDVPAHPALGQVVHRGEAPGERVGRVVRRAGRDAEDEVLGHGGHGRHRVQGVVHGELGPGREDRADVRRALVYVVWAQDVGDEHGVEAGTVEQPGQVCPEAELVVVGRLVARLVPLAW